MEYALRLAVYGAVTVLLGSLVFPYALAGSRAGDAAWRASVLRRTAAVGLGAALLLIPLILGRLIAQLDAMRFPEDPLFQSFGVLLEHTLWGKGWIMQIAGVLLVLIALTASFRGRGGLPGTLLGGLGALLLAVSLAISGHAAAASPATVAIVAHTLHLVGVGAWVGGLCFLILEMKGALRSGNALAMVRAFSPKALLGAALVAVSGVIASWMHLNGPTQLFASAYGQTLVAKLALVATVVALGYRNWKRNTPAVEHDGGRSLQVGAVRELAVMVLVLMVTSLLVVATPPVE